MLVERDFEFRAVALKLLGDPFAGGTNSVGWIVCGGKNITRLEGLKLLLRFRYVVARYLRDDSLYLWIQRFGGLAQTKPHVPSSSNSLNLFVIFV